MHNASRIDRRQVIAGSSRPQVHRGVSPSYTTQVQHSSCASAQTDRKKTRSNICDSSRGTLSWRRPRPVAKRLTPTSPLTEPQCLFSSPLHFYNTFHKKLDAPWRCSAMGLVIDLPGLGVIPKFGFHQSPRHRNEIYLLHTGLGIDIFFIHAVNRAMWVPRMARYAMVVKGSVDLGLAI